MTLNELIDNVSGQSIHYYVGAHSAGVKESLLVDKALGVQISNLTSRLQQLSPLIKALEMVWQMKVSDT